MKKVLLVLALVALCMSISSAQSPMTISVGPAAGIAVPMGDLSNVTGIGFFGGAKAKFSGVLAPVDLAASVTYNSWGGKDIGSGVKTDAWTGIEVTAGAQYPFPMEGAKPYVLADLMFTSLTAKVAIPSYTFGGVTYGGGTASASDSKFGFGFGAGVEVSGIDIFAKYQLIASGTNSLQAGACYYFSL